jgi:hypothetical protein
MLASFLLTFLIARILVLLIMTRRIADLYLYVGQTHVHHLNYGIFLLTAVGAYLLFFPDPRPRAWIVAAFGMGLALTFDEFGMWLHLGGPYWQRASYDAVIVIATTLALLAVAPEVWRMRPRQWVTATLSVLLLAAFVVLTVREWNVLAHRTMPKLERIEQSGPQ